MKKLMDDLKSALEELGEEVDDEIHQIRIGKEGEYRLE
jgi:hypothetical protein